MTLLSTNKTIYQLNACNEKTVVRDKENKSRLTI